MNKSQAAVEITIPNSMPLDVAGRLIDVGDKAVLMRNGRLLPGEIESIKEKVSSKTETIYKNWNDPELAKFLPKGFSHGQVLIHRPYWSTKVKTKFASYSTHDRQRIVITEKASF